MAMEKSTLQTHSGDGRYISPATQIKSLTVRMLCASPTGMTEQYNEIEFDWD